MIALWLLAPLAGLAAGALNRRRVIRVFEREYADRFPPDVRGIAAGAEGFVLQGTNGKGLLLLHGSGDSPQSLRYLGERLNTSGFTVHVPLLPGHGRSPRAFAVASAHDYLEAARRELDELRDLHEWVGIVGLSMGGALAAAVARGAPDVRVLILLAPYLIPPSDVRWAHRIAWLWRWEIPYLRGCGEESIHDAEARALSRAYGSFSAGAVEALMATAEAGRRALSELTLPTLVVNSAQDNRIPRALAEDALKELRAPTEQHWVTGCGHVITMDYCKSDVAALVLSFLARHAG